MRAGLRDGLTGEALIANPHVAVVVVAPFAGALGKRHRRGGDHPAAGAGQSLEHGVGVARVASPDRASSSGTQSRQTDSVADQACEGSGAGSGSELRSITSTRSRAAPWLELERHHERPALIAGGDRLGLGRPRPDHVRGTEPRSPDAIVVAAQMGGALGAELGAQIEHHVHLHVALDRPDLAQNDRPIGDVRARRALRGIRRRRRR